MKRTAYGCRIGLVLLAGLGACDSAATEPSTLASVVSASGAGLGVEMLTDDRVETGLTPIYLEVTTDAGQPVTDATVTFVPLMTMTGSMSHSAPVLGVPTLDDDGRYRVDVVFQMPTSDMGSWRATATVARPGAAPAEVTFPTFPVADSGRSKVFTWTDPATAEERKYIASLNFVEAPRIGLNPVIFTLHWKESAMSFVPVEDATIHLDPQMPSMGHGSPGSVDPTPTSSGRYAGQLSFSMTGEWETTATITRGGNVLGAPVFVAEF